MCRCVKNPVAGSHTMACQHRIELVVPRVGGGASGEASSCVGRQVPHISLAVAPIVLADHTVWLMRLKRSANDIPVGRAERRCLHRYRRIRGKGCRTRRLELLNLLVELWQRRRYRGRSGSSSQTPPELLRATHKWVLSLGEGSGGRVGYRLICAHRSSRNCRAYASQRIACSSCIIPLPRLTSSLVKCAITRIAESAGRRPGSRCRKLSRLLRKVSWWSHLPGIAGKAARSRPGSHARHVVDRARLEQRCLSHNRLPCRTPRRL